MARAIVLDSTPLALLVRRPDGGPVSACRRWAAEKVAEGSRLYVPAIIEYELRRELERLNSVGSLRVLDSFIYTDADRYLPLTRPDLRLAATLWADARRRGRPTADPLALDVDVILAAQARSLGLPDAQFVVATGNVKHLSQFVPAVEWLQV